jgi:hypothetical protein
MDMMMVEALNDWRSLAKMINLFNESQIRVMLDHECASARRKGVMIKLHARFGVLRSKRERAEMLGA